MHGNKIAKKYADLIVQANKSTGRKETVHYLNKQQNQKTNWINTK